MHITSHFYSKDTMLSKLGFTLENTSLILIPDLQLLQRPQLLQLRAAPAQGGSSVDPMVAMMMMNQQNQQMMMQQQAMLAQSQQNQQSSGPIIVNNVQQQQQGGMLIMSPGKDTATGYLLWCACFLLIFGAHRFYYNRPISGLLYLFTFGFLGFGQLYDLLVMRELARTA